jgi:hypothetical protein
VLPVQQDQVGGLAGLPGQPLQEGVRQAGQIEGPSRRLPQVDQGPAQAEPAALLVLLHEMVPLERAEQAQQGGLGKGEGLGQRGKVDIPLDPAQVFQHRERFFQSLDGVPLLLSHENDHRGTGGAVQGGARSALPAGRHPEV